MLDPISMNSVPKSEIFDPAIHLEQNRNNYKYIKKYSSIIGGADYVVKNPNFEQTTQKTADVWKSTREEIPTPVWASNKHSSLPKDYDPEEVDWGDPNLRY